MTREALRAQGYGRIERDDRLLDVFSNETPDKGVELWEKWEEENVKIVRFHNGKMQKFSITRLVLENALQENTSLELKNFE